MLVRSEIDPGDRPHDEPPIIGRAAHDAEGVTGRERRLSRNQRARDLRRR